MDGFVIPPDPSWFLQNSIIATPDNGLLYCSRYSVSYIPQVEKDCLPKIRVMQNSRRILSLACAPDWSEKRLFASVDEDRKVYVWDLDQGKPINGHDGHACGSKKANFSGQNHVHPNALCFSQNRKLLSCNRATLVVYCMLSDTFTVHTKLFRPKSVVVVLVPSPTNRDEFIAGMNDGLIQIFSIKKMSILHTLRAHSNEIVSIACMAVPVLSQKSASSGKPQRVKQSQELLTESAKKTDQARPKKLARKKAVPEADSSDFFDIYDFNESQEEFGTIIDRESQNKPDRMREKTKTVEGFNFLEACENLKDDIMKAATRRDDEDDDEEEDDDAGEHSHVHHESFNTDDEHELDDCEKLRDYVVVDNDTDSDEHEDGTARAAAPSEDVYETKVVLVSSSRERHVWFWDYDTGLPIDKIELPQSASGTIGKARFACAVWLDAGHVAVNDFTGQIKEWNVKFSLNNDRICLASEVSLARYPVGKIIFLTSARNVIKQSTAGSADPYLWCYSIARKLVCVQARPLLSGGPTAVLDYSCVMPVFQCVVENPLESMVIAMASTHSIDTVNLASLQYDRIAVSSLWNNVAGNIMSLDWHPEDEQTLVFGTDEGRISMVDCEKPGSSKTVPLKSFTNKTIYGLKWCYLTNSTNEKRLVLFAASKSDLAYYYRTAANEYEPVICKQFGAVSQVSAANDMCFIGTQNGFVFVTDLQNDLHQLYKSKIAKRYITCMEFKKNWLAVSSNDNNVALINFSNGIDDKDDTNITLLEGHTEGVCKLRWSRGESMRLVSCSFDSSIRVWDATSGTCLSVFQTGYFLYGAMFSPLDENIVVYIGKGCSVGFFDYIKQQSTLNPLALKGHGSLKGHPIKFGTRMQNEGDRPVKSAIGRNGPEVSSLPVVASGVSDEQRNSECKQPSDTSVDKLADDVQRVSLVEKHPPQLRTNVVTTFQLAYREVNRPKEVLECIVKLLHIPEPDPEADLVTNPEDDASDYEGCEELAEFKAMKIEPKQTAEAKDVSPSQEQPDDGGKVFYNEKLFTTEEKLKQLIQEEANSHQTSATSSIGMIILPQLLHKLKEVILEHVSKKKLTPQLLALAPYVSHVFWRQCCQAYAYQLIEGHHSLAAVPYFLASHKVDESIEALCDAKYYREAWAVCRLQKMADDPILEKVAADWAQHLESTGNLEGAALVWTGVKKYEKAVDVLSKRRDITEEIQRTIDELTRKLQDVVSDVPRAQ